MPRASDGGRRASPLRGYFAAMNLATLIVAMTSISIDNHPVWFVTAIVVATANFAVVIDDLVVAFKAMEDAKDN